MLDKIVSQVNGIVWNPVLVILLIAAGLYFSLRTRFVQVRRFKLMLKSLFSKKEDAKGISSFEESVRNGTLSHTTNNRV